MHYFSYYSLFDLVYITAEVVNVRIMLLSDDHYNDSEVSSRILAYMALIRGKLLIGLLGNHHISKIITFIGYYSLD